MLVSFSIQEKECITVKKFVNKLVQHEPAETFCGSCESIKRVMAVLPFPVFPYHLHPTSTTLQLRTHKAFI